MIKVYIIENFFDIFGIIDKINYFIFFAFYIFTILYFKPSQFPSQKDVIKVWRRLTKRLHGTTATQF